MTKLTKSQRLKAIKEIAGSLAHEDWTTIDLTLKTFGFPIASQWSGDTTSYIVDKIGDAQDEQLAELAEHFGIDGYSTGSTPSPDPPFWSEGSFEYSFRILLLSASRPHR